MPLASEAGGGRDGAGKYPQKLAVAAVVGMALSEGACAPRLALSTSRLCLQQINGLITDS